MIQGSKDTITVQCRLCGAKIDLSMNPTLGALQRDVHLTPHVWQMLRLIQGKEGDGSIMRFMQALAFHAPGESVTGVPNKADDINSPESEGLELDPYWRIQADLFRRALAPPAVDSKLKGGI